jgi:ABC-type Fe3+/spermidine/putrescine transport system ATPase subunit
MPFLDLNNLSKSFGDTPVLRDVSLSVDEGETLVLLGPSGSGKTTLLRLLAGFESPDAGELRLADKEIASLSPARRNFGMVFQHYALFPHLTVGENVAFGLEARRMRGEAVHGRVQEVLALVDLEGFESRRIGELSGGQQQRVALARALAPEPKVLLLDEPLSNLDPSLRERTRRELREALRRVGITTIFVTHEQEEAFHFGDRVAVLHRGRLDQVGRPEALYREPATRFVATFVGRARVLPAVATEHGARLEGTAVEWPAIAADGVTAGAPVDLVVRPESVRLVAAGASTLSGEVVERRYLGSTTLFVVRLDRGALIEVLGPLETAREGERVGVERDPRGLEPRMFPRREETSA